MTTVSNAISVAALCLLLAGCATNRTGTEGIRAFYCGTETTPGAYVPVRWSEKDTDETIFATKANNAVYKATC